MGRRKAATSRLEQAKAAHAEASLKVGKLEAARNDALLADRDDEASQLDAELETLRRLLRGYRDKIGLLQSEAEREEAAERVRRHEQHIKQVENLLGEREQAAGELADATAKLVAAFRKTIASSERIGAAWPWAGHDRNAAMLSAQNIHAALAHEFFRTSHVPFLGGRPGEKIVPSLPGSVSSRMTEWLGFPERAPSLVNVCKEATGYAARRMRETAAQPVSLAVWLEDREKTAAQPDMPSPTVAANGNGDAAAAEIETPPPMPPTPNDLPPGHRADLAFVSLWKGWLVSGALPLAERLRTLEAIAACVRGPVTAEVVAAVEPANGVFEQIVTEAIRLAAGSEDGKPCFDILERPDAFEDLTRLNPSIGAAPGRRMTGPNLGPNRCQTARNWALQDPTRGSGNRPQIAQKHTQAY